MQSDMDGAAAFLRSAARQVISKAVFLSSCLAGIVGGFSLLWSFVKVAESLLLSSYPLAMLVMFLAFAVILTFMSASLGLYARRFLAACDSIAERCVR